MTTAEASNDNQERAFRYPSQIHLLTVLSYVLTVAVVWVFCAPGVLGYEGKERIEPMILLFAFPVIYGLVRFLPLWGRYREVRLDRRGITVGRHFAPWEDVLKIDRCTFPDPSIRLRLRYEKPRFLTLKGPLRELRLPRSDFVYREVLPAILVRVPGVEVSERARRELDDPEGAGRPAIWFPFVALTVNVAILVWVLSDMSLDLIRFLIGSAALYLVNSQAHGLWLKTIRDVREDFIRIAFVCVMLLTLGFSFNEFFVGNPGAFRAMAATALVISLLAFGVLLFADRLRKFAQLCIVLVLLATPTATYLHAKARAWPTEDLCDHFDAENFIMPVWGRSGRYLSPYGAEDLDHVLHLPDMSTRRVPKHPGTNVIVWLDQRIFMRKAEGDNGAWGLFLYDFTTDRENTVPTADVFGVGRVRPVSTDGKLHAWVDCPTEEGRQRLRIWNMETRSDVRPPVALPAHDILWEKSGPFWIDRKTVVAYGSTREVDRATNDKSSLVVLRVSLDGGPSKPFVSRHRFMYWHLTTDGRYAVAVNEEVAERFVVGIVDLLDDKLRMLPGDGGYPLMTDDPPGCFRVTMVDGRNVLTRIDLPEGTEGPLQPVPRGLDLITVSRTGRFAIFGSGKPMGRASFIVMHVPSGARHRVDLPGRILSTSEAMFQTKLRLSIFSPDERRFVMDVVSLGCRAVVLCTIPEDWPEQSD